MKAVLRRRPSGAMVVAMIALLLAASGTAVAASKLVSGDKVIKKHSLSGNRLRNHTITGTQVNMAKLGKVRSAKHADSASTATNATNATNAKNATNATHATTAGNAATVGGQGPSAFEPAANFIRTGLVKANAGQTVPLAKFGPFTLTLTCNDGGGGNVQGEIDATSTEANSDGYGTTMTTAGTSYQVLVTSFSTTAQESDDNAADFITPSGKAYIADLTVGENQFGLNACFANALVSPS
jgi:hypothetical protein